MNTLKRIALVLLLVSGSSTPLLAQSEADPPPQNPVFQEYEGGKILVAVRTPRHFGYHMGERIPVRLVISADPDVAINIEEIERRILSGDGSDFEFFENPVITRRQEGGKNITVIDLTLTRFVLKNSVLFTADFYYSVEKLPDGNPSWKRATSPLLVITSSNTATESSQDLLEGDTAAKRSPLPPAIQPLRIAGTAILFVVGCYLMFGVYRRLFPPRIAPPNEVAWAVFSKVAANATKAGANYENTQLFTNALRAYFEVEAVDFNEAKPVIANHFAGQPKVDEKTALALATLKSLEIVLYQRPDADIDSNTPVISAQQFADLIKDIERIVPRP